MLKNQRKDTYQSRVLMNCPPPAGSPRFARGTEAARFPLLAGGTAWACA